MFDEWISRTRGRGSRSYYDYYGAFPPIIKTAFDLLIKHQPMRLRLQLKAAHKLLSAALDAHCVKSLQSPGLTRGVSRSKQSSPASSVATPNICGKGDWAMGFVDHFHSKNLTDSKEKSTLGSLNSHSAGRLDQPHPAFLPPR